MSGGSAKDLVIKPITSRASNRLMKRNHYSGKVAQNSQLHLGVFYEGVLRGALQFGPPLDRSKLLGLVRGAPWESVLELNRMWLSDRLPRNGESRSIAIACRLIKRHAPQVKWIVSFADGTQCGDGTIYRASGFLLTGMTKSKNLARMPSGEVIHKMSLESNPARKRPDLGGRSYYQITGGRYDWAGFCRSVGAEVLTGVQFRYLKFIDQSWASRLTVPVIPFEDIPDSARMYLGLRVSPTSGGSGVQPEEGGAKPTLTLHPDTAVEAP